MTRTGGPTIGKVDFIGVPSRDSERSRRFYVETLGLRPDAPPALHVDDVAAARSSGGRG
jgi:catechol 2,3-dioxygenase-like lactoylglutathione lyase family enzyme